MCERERESVCVCVYIVYMCARICEEEKKRMRMHFPRSNYTYRKTLSHLSLSAESRSKRSFVNNVVKTTLYKY